MNLSAAEAASLRVPLAKVDPEAIIETCADRTTRVTVQLGALVPELLTDVQPNGDPLDSKPTRLQYSRSRASAFDTTPT